jgi:heme-degrading monooxygenase HmoA
MQARVTTHTVHTGRTQERLRHAVERSVPLVRRQEGFRGILMLLDRATHGNMTVSLWETEADESRPGRPQDAREHLRRRPLDVGRRS